MNWFKFYGGEYLSDPKMLALGSPERSCWLTLLCYASMTDKGGIIKHLSEEMLMAQSGIDPMDDIWDRTHGVLKKFEKLEMITLDNDTIVIINWKKRQEMSLTPYERVKRYREKLKSKDIKDNADNKSDNDRVDKIRVDKIRINKSAEASSASPLKNKKQDDTPMSLKEFVAWCKKSSQRHIQIIGEWAEAEEPDYTTKSQWDRFIHRNLRPANSLIAFTPEQLEKAYDRLQKDVVRIDKNSGKKVGFITKYTLETLNKYI